MIRPIVSLLLTGVLAWPVSAAARGGHFFGGGRFHGSHVDSRGPYRDHRDRRQAQEAAVYLMIDASSVADSSALTVAVDGLQIDLAAAHGRLIADDVSPAAISGEAPKAFVMIAFDDEQSARRWKDSPAYRSFEAGLGKAATVREFSVNAVPVIAARAARNARYDAANQKLINDRDKVLKGTGNICGGC